MYKQNSYVLVGLLGVALGYLLPNNSSSNETALNEISIDTPNKQSTTSTILEESSITYASSDLTPTDTIGTDESLTEASEFLSDQTPGLEELEIEELEIEDLDSQSIDILAGVQLETLDSSEMKSLELNFKSWLDNNENSAETIIEFLASGNTDEEKQVLEYLIAAGTAMGSYDGLAESLIKQLSQATEAEYPQWEQIMGVLTIDSTAARDELFKTLPALTEDAIVSASLKAVRPALILPEERAEDLS